MSVPNDLRLAGANPGPRRAADGIGPDWRIRAAALAVASCFAGQAIANPTGAAVVSGTASIQSQGNLLSITNSPNAIINWQNFSIGANEITRFIQQSPSSAVLNRIVGQDPSTILGALQSNGRVFLINPNGIAFGPNAMIDVAGLVASTLNMADSDFLAGRLKFSQTTGAKGITNQGSIATPAGGQVYLIAPNIENSGLIKTPRGEIILAAGQSVELVDVGTPDLRVQITAPAGQAVNLGQIVADSGRIGVYAGLISNAGTVSADTAVVGDKGQIIFKATRDIALEPGSLVTASGAPGGVHDGGTVGIVADGALDMKQGSQVRVDGGADGGNGGYLELSGKQNIALNGEYTGRALQPGYRGGTLLIDPDAIVICDPNDCGGATPVALGGSGSIAAGDMPGQTLYLETNMAQGGWTNVSLAANNSITLLTLLEDNDVPAGGSLTLGTIAGDIVLNADIGTSATAFQHALAFNAGGNMQFNRVIYQGAQDLTATAGGDVVVDGNRGGSIYSGGSVALTGANVKVLGGPFSGFSDAYVNASGNVSLTGTQSVLVQGGQCLDGCANAGVNGANVTLAGGSVTVAGGNDALGGGYASVYAQDTLQVSGTSLAVQGGRSSDYYGGAYATVSANNVSVAVSQGVTVQGGTATGTAASYGSAYASVQGYQSTVIDAGGAVNIVGGTASGNGYYDASASVSGGSVDITGASFLLQGGTADTSAGGNYPYADASARLSSGGDANLTVAGGAVVRGGTATGADGSAYAQAEISGAAYSDSISALAAVDQAAVIIRPPSGTGTLTLKADSLLIQGGQANAQATLQGVSQYAYADAHAAVDGFNTANIQTTRGVGLAAGNASGSTDGAQSGYADASVMLGGGDLVKISAGGSIQTVAGTATASPGAGGTADVKADAGIAASTGSIVTDSAAVLVQGGNVSGGGVARALMAAATEVNATVRGAGSIDLVAGNDSLGAYAAVVAAPSTIYLTFPGRFNGGFSPAGITNGTTGFFTFAQPGDLSSLDPAVLGQNLIVSYGLTLPILPPFIEDGGLELPNNIFVYETNNAANFYLNGGLLPPGPDDAGKSKQVCS